MRILQINAFHYLLGGVERAYFDTSRWLTDAGHEVAHFATEDPRNLDSPTRRFFAPHADYGEGAPLASQLTQLHRVLWSAPAARAMERLLGAWRPDIAHVHAPSRYLTPAVLRPLERAGIPMVMTLHDFKPWCTNRVMFARGAPCERCRGGRHIQALVVGCIQGSRMKSAVGAAEAYLHQALGAYRSVRRWIAPSQFVFEKVVEHGLDADRVRVLPHGVRPEEGDASRASIGAGAEENVGPELVAAPYALFAGRLSAEKGVRLLPAIAMRIAPTPLAVAGDGPLRGWLEHQAAALPNLRVLGHRSGAGFRDLLARARVVLVPSLFYETFCYAAAEALLAARPVVASRIGAIPELIEHERTGLLIQAGDAHGAAEAVRRALADDTSLRWGEEGRAHVLTVADPRRHIEGLLAIYREAMEERKP